MLHASAAVPRTWHMVGRGVGRWQPVGGTDGRVVAPVPGRLASRATRLAAHPLHFTSLHTSHDASAFNRGRDTTNFTTAETCARASGDRRPISHSSWTACHAASTPLALMSCVRPELAIQLQLPAS